MGGITFDADRLREIGERYGIARLEAFGSVGRGDHHGDSDLDLFLVRPHDADGSWSDDVAALAATASRWTGNDVRPLEYGEAEIEGGDDPVLRDIEQSGITLSGDRAWFRRALAKR